MNIKKISLWFIFILFIITTIYLTNKSLNENNNEKNKAEQEMLIVNSDDVINEKIDKTSKEELTENVPENLSKEYNVFLEKTEWNYNPEKLVNSLKVWEISEDFFKDSLKYISSEKIFSNEILNLIKNLNYYEELLGLEVENNEHECDLFRYFLYFFDIEDFKDYNIYNSYSITCYKRVVNNYNFIKDPLWNYDLIEYNKINKILYNYKKGETISEEELLSDPRLYFMVVDDDKLFSREQFSSKAEEVMWLNSKNKADMLAIKFMLARIWIDLFYEDISLFSKEELLKKITSNFYDYLLIDRGVFRWKDYCWDILNPRIEEICDLTFNKGTKESKNKYKKIFQEYLIHRFIYE